MGLHMVIYTYMGFFGSAGNQTQGYAHARQVLSHLVKSPAPNVIINCLGTLTFAPLQSNKYLFIPSFFFLILNLLFGHAKNTLLISLIV
jgi:hypothetical protein